MKALNNLKNILESVDGYKHQFVTNELTNILIVDPVMSRFDFYSLILPAIQLQISGLANVAFTGISKFTDSSEKKPVNLTDVEVKWSDVIVFPFSLDDYNFESVHLFDTIKTQNPSVKIIFICEVLFSHSKFNASVISDFNKINAIKATKAQQEVIVEYVQRGVREKIMKADKVIVPNGNILKEVLKIDKNKLVHNILPLNYNEIIRQGLTVEELKDEKIMEFLSLDEVRVLIHFVNIGKASDSFIKNVVSKAPDNVIFYSQSKIKGIELLPKCSITHWYKVLFLHSFDFTFFVGDFNKYDINSQYLDGVIVDSLFMRSVPVVTNKNFESVLSVKDFESIPEENLLNLLKMKIQDRVDLNFKYSQKIKDHEVNSEKIDDYSRLFLEFKEC